MREGWVFLWEREREREREREVRNGGERKKLNWIKNGVVWYFIGLNSYGAQNGVVWILHFEKAVEVGLLCVCSQKIGLNSLLEML